MQCGRWVSYICQYRDNVRCENAGFFKVQKVDIKGTGKARIQLGIRLYKDVPIVCDVYLLLQGKKITKLMDFCINARESDVIIKRIELPWNNSLEDGISLEGYDGVIVLCSDGETLAGMWKNYEPNFGGVEKTEKKDDRNPTIIDDAEINISESMEREQVLERVAATEINKECDPVQDIIDTYPRLPLFMDSPFLECVKIVPQDIGKLHLSNWKLGSNSFLNHSFHRYKYLMIGRVKLHDGEKQVVGVPGVYTNKEKYVANMFGFCRFVPLKKTNTMTGKFGYWIWEILSE